MYKSNPNIRFKEVEEQLTDICQRVIHTTVTRQNNEVTHVLNRQSESLKKTPIIKLNVGGKKYTTTLATLTYFPRSRLGRMFQGIIPVYKDYNDDEDFFFIDRNGEYFSYILDFFRDKVVYLPSDPFLRQKIREEMAYFQLEPQGTEGTLKAAEFYTWTNTQLSNITTSKENVITATEKVTINLQKKEKKKQATTDNGVSNDSKIMCSSGGAKQNVKTGYSVSINDILAILVMVVTLGRSLTWMLLV